ncbi:MAG TPA: IS4 family transposase [Clostridium sp.]|uniref:IS4 family transposase n=1 Tax=Clostridium sp. TaxID=1506 RepID=UPI002F956CD4
MNRKFRRKILEIKNVFDEEGIRNIATKTKFTQRESKFDSIKFLKLCVFSDDGLCKNSLSKLCTLIQKTEKTSITTEGLNLKFNSKSVEFLKEILLNLLSKQDNMFETTLNSVKNKFKKIRIMDSTHYSLPDNFKDKYVGNGGSASEAAAKIHLEYDLLTGAFLNLKVTSGTKNDADYMLDIIHTVDEGDLCLRDLGYYSMYCFDKLVQKKAFFISKIKSTTCLYSTNPEYRCYSTYSGEKKEESFKIDIKKVLEPLEEGQIIELSDIQIGKTHKINSRVIVTKLLEKVKEERRMRREFRAKKNKVKNSNPSLDGANVYMTNIPSDVIDRNLIYKIYSLRWQIELIFKVWKSQFEIHVVNKVKIERYECFIYGKLISLLLGSVLINLADNKFRMKENNELSTYKSYNVIRTYLSDLRLKIFSKENEFLKLIELILNDIFTNGRKAKRNSKLTPRDILKLI